MYYSLGGYVKPGSWAKGYPKVHCLPQHTFSPERSHGVLEVIFQSHSSKEKVLHNKGLVRIPIMSELYAKITKDSIDYVTSTYIHTSSCICIHITYILTYVHTLMHAFIHTLLHTYIHTYAYMHAYTCLCTFVHT